MQSEAISPAVDCGIHSTGAAEFLSQKELRELSRLSPARAAGQIALEYAAVASAVLLCEHFWSPALYALTFAFVGARYLALAILMHDAAHYRLFPNRKLNDFVGSYLLGPAALLSMQDYRKGHLIHHRHLGDEMDPEVPFRKMLSSKGQAAVLVVGSLLGISALMLITGVNRGWRRWAAVAALPAVGVLAWQWPPVGRIVALYWLFPFFIWTAGINVLRTFAEHTTVNLEKATKEEKVYAARNILASWLARIFIAPNSVGYHLDHHLYPSVPFYRLPKLHALLMTKEGYGTHSRDYRGYPDVIRDHIDRTAVAA